MSRGLPQDRGALLEHVDKSFKTQERAENHNANALLNSLGDFRYPL